MLRSSCRLLLVVTLFLVNITKSPVVNGQQQDGDADQKPVEVREPLDAETLAAVLKKQIRILNSSDPEKSLRAMRTLQDLRAQASPAIPNLCVKLGDSDHAIRRAAVETLEAIGEDSIAPLRQIMQTESGTKRAAAIGALVKLQGIKFEEFDQLVRDPDVRIRAAAAVGLASSGKPGVPLLVRLLADRELAVAYQAASSLGTNWEGDSIAIPALIQGLGRHRLAQGAVRALVAFRTEANRSIPWIIQAEPVECFRELFDNHVDEMWSDLGQADVADIPMLIACLKHKHPLARERAALKLGELGETAAVASAALEAAAISTFEEGVAIDKSPRSGRRWPYDEARPYWSAADECLRAYWEVTVDLDRANDFLKEYQSLVKSLNGNGKEGEEAEDQDELPDLYSSGGLGSSVQNTYRRVKGYAKRPDDISHQNIKVVWYPAKLNALSNDCTISGVLVLHDQQSDRMSPVNWFQGVGLYLAKMPETRLDWTAGTDDVQAIREYTVLNREGRFQFKIDLRRLKRRREVAEAFQMGIVLATHSDDEVTVEWKRKQSPIPGSVQMITIPEATPLSHELEMLNRVRSWPKRNVPTVDLINTVNALQKLGKDLALETLERYLELDDGLFVDDDRQTVFWIVRLLFEPIRADESIPVPGTEGIRRGEDGELRSLLEVVTDIPFAVSTYGPNNPDDPRSHIAWAWRHGIMRDKQLIPRNNPLEAAEWLINSGRLRDHKEEMFYDDESRLISIHAQALAMTGGLIPPLIPRGSSLRYGDFGMGGMRGQTTAGYIEWQLQRIIANLLQIHWSAEKQRFVTGIVR